MLDFEEKIDTVMLCATVLLACVVGGLFEFWKGNQLGQWEPMKLTAAAVVFVAAGVLLLVKLRQPEL